MSPGMSPWRNPGVTLANPGLTLGQSRGLPLAYLTRGLGCGLTCPSHIFAIPHLGHRQRHIPRACSPPRGAAGHAHRFSRLAPERRCARTRPANQAFTGVSQYGGGMVAQRARCRLCDAGG